MKFDIYLYGKTRTYDYTEMYMPEWIETGSEQYSEYKKAVSYLFSIREHIPESEASVLNDTDRCFVYYSGRHICMFGRHCHISGTDEFGRSVFSCEGFVCRAEDQKKFWISVPEMMLYLIDRKKTYYEEYISDLKEDMKPEAVSREENIIAYSQDQRERILSGSGLSDQFNALSEAIVKKAVPFGFVAGNQKKSLFDYSCPKELNKPEKFFTKDICTEITDDELWIKQYRPLTYVSEKRKYCIYLDVSLSLQNRLRYRLAAGCVPGSDEKISDISYVSYEKEEGLEVSFNSVLGMEEALRKRMINDGYSEVVSNDLLFEKEVIK